MDLKKMISFIFFVLLSLPKTLYFYWKMELNGGLTFSNDRGEI